MDIAADVRRNLGDQLAVSVPGRSEPSVGVIAFDGMMLTDLLLPYRIASGPIAVTPLAPKTGTLWTACGAPVRISVTIADRSAGLDALVVPCSAIQASGYSNREAITSLAQLIALPLATLFVASDRRMARRAHVLLCRPPMMSSGQFFERLGGPGHLPEVIRDGRATWAIGKAALTTLAPWPVTTA